MYCLLKTNLVFLLNPPPPPPPPVQSSSFLMIPAVNQDSAQGQALCLVCKGGKFFSLNFSRCLDSPTSQNLHYTHFVNSLSLDRRVEVVVDSWIDVAAIGLPVAVLAAEIRRLLGAGSC